MNELKAESEDITELLQELESVFEWTLKKAVEARSSHREAQADILGIQMKKQTQIRRSKERIIHGEEKYVQDIMLITIPVEEASNTYREWISHGRMSGGPDKTWDWEFKKIIFEGVLKRILSPDEMVDEWRKIRKGSTRAGEVKLQEPTSIDIPEREGRKVA